MRRLIDQYGQDGQDGPAGPAEAQDQALRYVVGLLQAATPAPLDPARKVRVRAALHTPRRRTFAWPLLRLAPAALLLLCSMALAGMLWQRVVHRPRSSAAPAPARPVPAAAAPAVPVPAVAAPAPAMDPGAQPGGVGPGGPLTSPPAGRSRAQRAPSEAESAMMLAAVRALRREHDPGRAGVLLEDYLRIYPDGSLVEEALALSIEAAARGAASEGGGQARAASLAAAYLRRFPQGRFREVAQRALRSGEGDD